MCIRQHRSCDGALLDALTSGLILRIVQRADTLVSGDREREQVVQAAAATNAATSAAKASAKRPGCTSRKTSASER